MVNLTLLYLPLPDNIYSGDFFQTLYDYYSPIHLPLSATICIFGVLANTLNVIVLTRKSMLSPTNILLTGLSVAQLCLVTNYLLLLAYNASATVCLWPALHGYSFVFYKWINVNLNVVFHSVATSLTLTISILRFLAVRAPTYSRTRVNSRWSQMALYSIYGAMPILCSPMFFMSFVGESQEERGKCNLEIVYELEYTDDENLIQAVMWIFGVLFKLLPSLAIAFFSFFLIKSLKEYQKKKAKLISGQKSREKQRKSISANDQEMEHSQNKKSSLIHDKNENENEILLSTNTNTKRVQSGRKGDRKQLTKMLLAVALLCVSVELPHGIVNLLTAVFGQRFATQVYDNLGDIFEMLTLLYSSVNFLLFCFINVEYQKAVIALMMACVKKLPGHFRGAPQACRV